MATDDLTGESREQPITVPGIDLEKFRSLIASIQTGDQQAAEALVRDYESLIRREVRSRLVDQRLRRVLDSMDICQSVLASFFVGSALGEFDLNDPKQLIRLLVMMTRNKVASVARREHSQKRDQRRNSKEEDALEFIKGCEDTPSQIVADRELLNRVREAMTDEELQIANARSNSDSWESIANQFGGTAQARRVQYSRALDRLRQEFGFGDA